MLYRIIAIKCKSGHTREDPQKINFAGQPQAVGAMLPAFHGFSPPPGEEHPDVRGRPRAMLGGGLELAAFCSWILASPDAMFGQPEIKLAVFPPMASLLLPWRLGGARGLDSCVSGRSVSADVAMKMGLVHSIAEDPVEACVAFAQRAPPRVLRVVAPVRRARGADRPHAPDRRDAPRAGAPLSDGADGDARRERGNQRLPRAPQARLCRQHASRRERRLVTTVPATNPVSRSGDPSMRLEEIVERADARHHDA